MKYLKKMGLYQERYNELFNKYASNEHSDSIIGEMLRIITDLYSEVIRQMALIDIRDNSEIDIITDFQMSRKEFEFLSNQRYLFKIHNNDDLYDYFIYELYQQLYFHWEHKPTNFPGNFTYTIDLILDHILKVYGEIQSEQFHN